MGVSRLGRLLICVLLAHGSVRNGAYARHRTGSVHDAPVEGSHLLVRSTQRGSNTTREDSVAICLVCRDQQRDLREWATHHAQLGVDKIYIFDDNSRVPLLGGNQDLVDSGVRPDCDPMRMGCCCACHLPDTAACSAGLVQYEAVGALQGGQRAQLVAYNECLKRYGSFLECTVREMVTFMSGILWDALRHAAPMDAVHVRYRYRKDHQWMAFIGVLKFQCRLLLNQP